MVGQPEEESLLAEFCRSFECATGSATHGTTLEDLPSFGLARGQRGQGRTGTDTPHEPRGQHRLGYEVQRGVGDTPSQR